MHSNSPTLLTAKIQLPVLLFLSVLPLNSPLPPSPSPTLSKRGNQDFTRDMLMGDTFFEIVLGGTKMGHSILSGSSVGGTCQGWSIFL